MKLMSYNLINCVVVFSSDILYIRVLSLWFRFGSIRQLSKLYFYWNSDQKKKIQAKLEQNF